MAEIIKKKKKKVNAAASDDSWLKPFGGQEKEAAKGAGIEVTSGDDRVSGFTEPPQLEE